MVVCGVLVVLSDGKSVFVSGFDPQLDRLCQCLANLHFLGVSISGSQQNEDEIPSFSFQAGTIPNDPDSFKSLWIHFSGAYKN